MRTTTILVLMTLALCGLAYADVTSTAFKYNDSIIFNASGLYAPMCRVDGSNYLTSTGLVATQFVSGGTVLNGSSLTVEQVNQVLYVKAGNATDIQAKINLCSGQCTVHVPSGVYNLPSAVNLVSNLNLIGDSAGTTILKAATTSGALLNGENLEHIKIEGLQINHTKVTSDIHAIRLLTSKNVIIKDNIVYGGSHHNIITSGENFTIEGNVVLNAGRGGYDGVGIIVKGRNNIVKNNRIDDSDFSAIEVYEPSYENIIDGNIIHWSGSNGNLGAIAVMSNSYNTVVTNNIIKGDGTNKGGSGIKISGAFDTVVTGNIISDINQTAGVHITVSTLANRTTISDNIFSGGYGGIFLEGDNTMIDGNSFDNLADEAIYIRSTSLGTIVNGNKILDCAGNSIRIGHEGNTAVINNQLINSGGNAIFVENVDNVLIVGNYVTGSTGYGIRFQNTNNTLATSNWLCGNTNGAYQNAGIESGSNVTGNMIC